jgi:hypothetical protein
MPRLKVFVTTSGVRDHIVAAPSRPAALKAWGAKTDLFSMGVAKEVTDSKITKQALARPGEVISLTRSGEIADDSSTPKRNARKKTAAKPPSRARLAAAEKQLEELRAKQTREREEIEREQTALARKLDQLDKRHGKARRAAEEKVEDARDAYQAALDDWST